MGEGPLAAQGWQEARLDKVRVGLIGAGGVARARHLPRLAAIDEVDLALVW